MRSDAEREIFSALGAKLAAKRANQAGGGSVDGGGAAVVVVGAGAAVVVVGSGGGGAPVPRATLRGRMS